MSIKTPLPIIEAKNLFYEINGEKVITDFSFSIQKGEYVAVFGPNGGGKTTLLRLMLGLLKPTGGEIKILGKSLSDSKIRRQIGYVAQRGGNLDSLFPASVVEVVQAGRLPFTGLFGGLSSRDHLIVEETMECLSITNLKNRPISRLSGGQRQRVLLARALCGEPKILFLDEPIDGLDSASRENFYKLLQQIHKDGVTIVFVSHDVHALAKEATSALCLQHEFVCHGSQACHVQSGQFDKILKEASPHNLYHASKKELLAHHNH